MSSPACGAGSAASCHRSAGPLENFTGEGPLNRRADQWFLRDRVWPTIRQSVLTHDRHYRVLNAVDFPEGSDLPGGRHVGQYAAATSD